MHKVITGMSMDTWNPADLFSLLCRIWRNSYITAKVPLDGLTKRKCHSKRLSSILKASLLSGISINIEISI